MASRKSSKTASGAAAATKATDTAEEQTAPDQPDEQAAGGATEDTTNTAPDTARTAADELAETKPAAAPDRDAGGASQETKPEQPAAAPLEPPDLQTKPAAGNPNSSTNPVAANAAVRTLPGDQHRRLVVPGAEPGTFEPADPDDLWFDQGPRFTIVQSRHRLFEEFTHHNARRTDRRLLYNQGTPVRRDQANELTELARSARR